VGAYLLFTGRNGLVVLGKPRSDSSHFLEAHRAHAGSVRRRATGIGEGVAHVRGTGNEVFGERADRTLADLLEALVYAGFAWGAGTGDVDAAHELVETVGAELATRTRRPWSCSARGSSSAGWVESGERRRSGSGD